MITPLWKIISLLMSLGTFGAVATLSVMGGDELPWVIVRSVISFAICWIILSNLGNILTFVLPNPGDDLENAEEANNEKG